MLLTCRSQVISHQRFATHSLFVLSISNPLRRPLLRLVTWRVFEWAMLSTILANCITLAMSSSAPGFEETPVGKALQVSNLVFIGIFTSEAVCKIIALGFLWAPYTYLRDGAPHGPPHAHMHACIHATRGGTHAGEAQGAPRAHTHARETKLSRASRLVQAGTSWTSSWWCLASLRSSAWAT